MLYSNPDVMKAAKQLKKKFAELEDKQSILKSPEIKNLYANIKGMEPEEKAAYGVEVNQLKNELKKWIDNDTSYLKDDRGPIDVTAPFDVNVDAKDRPKLLRQEDGSKHPISSELERIKDIFTRMGFVVEDSRQLDSEYNMFSALNFPENHPARDDYDTFMTEEGLIPPAHTSTMQNRILKKHKPPIRAVIPGRTFRNEDVDATHEHTFHQVEGVYVDKNISVSDMLGTIVTFLEEYFGESLEYKTQPFFFPFVEPGMEFLIKMPESIKKAGTTGDQWLEIMGCGMIHPEVLKAGGVDPKEFSGFAWGFGVERLIMLKHGIEDIRHFNSAKLDFLRSF